MCSRCWKTGGRAKNAAVAKLAADGKSDTGAQARDARHMQSIAAFVQQMFIDAGLPEHEVTIDSVVPGYFRRSKNWDVVAIHKGHLVGVVELKSQASSPGNNANNRIEEAIGSSVDAKTVQEMTKAFGTLGVWSAWCMTFNRDCESGVPIKPVPPRQLRVPAIDPAFQDMTYATQYATAIEWVHLAEGLRRRLDGRHLGQCQPDRRIRRADLDGHRGDLVDAARGSREVRQAGIA